MAVSTLAPVGVRVVANPQTPAACNAPAVPFRVTMLLADSAQVSENKLYILGGGWDLTGPGPTPSAVAMLIQVPWDQTNRRHRWRLELVDSDGQSVVLATPMGNEEPVQVTGEFEVGRPPGIPPGTPIHVPVAFTIGALPLEPGHRYEWRLTIGRESDEDWRLAFNVRPEKP
jgi:hypothetical protein